MSNSIFEKVLFIVTGAAIGSAITLLVLKSKYEVVNDDKKEPEDPNQQAIEDYVKNDISITREAYENLAKNYSGSEEDNKKEDCKKMKPYVISPEEFADGDYPQKTLTYYANKVLADEDDEVVLDVENTVGEESLTHFGEYEDDTVFVRDDDLGIDYEICLDTRRYADIYR